MLRLGIIGCGRVTTMFHTRAIKSVKNIQITAVSDINEDRCANVQLKTGAKQRYLDYKELIQDPEIDAVAINTPPKTHEEMVIRSLNHGKHVLCEKPLAQSVEACNKIKKLQLETGLVVLPAHNYSFTPSLIQMEKLIRESVIGDVRRVEIIFENNLKSYRSKTDFRVRQHNGIVEDVIPHVMSLSMPLSGRVKTVSEVSWWCKEYEVCDNLETTFKTVKDIEVNCSLSWTSLVPKSRIIVVGSKGRLNTDFMMNPYQVTLEVDGKKKNFDEKGWSWYLDLFRFRHPSFERQYRHFERLTRGLDEPRITIDDEINILETVDKISERLNEPPSR